MAGGLFAASIAEWDLQDWIGVLLAVATIAGVVGGGIVRVSRFLTRIESKVDAAATEIVTVGEKLVDHMDEEERMRRSDHDRVSMIKSQVDRMEGKLDILVAHLPHVEPSAAV